MAKANNKATDNKKIQNNKYLDWIFIGALLVSVYVFLAPGIFGEDFAASDNIASESFRTYLDDAKESGDYPLWIPYIFSGMPSYSALLTTGERVWDFVPQIVFGIGATIGDILGSDHARVAFYYALYAIGMFVLMRSKKHNHFVSFFTAFAAVFSTVVITWIMIGHNTKPIVLMMFPWIFFLLEKLRVKFSLLYAALLIFAVHLMFEGAHIQMMFYGFAAFGIYILFELITRFARKQEPMGMVRATAILIVAAGMAFLMSSDRYLAVLDYTPYSTRGSAPLNITDDTNKNSTGGNDYEYATMWSFDPAEIITFFVPSYYGFGKRDISELTGSSDKQVQSVYWGEKPIEDSPPYMGIIVLIFGIFGAIMYRKDVFVQFLIVVSLFALFLAFGRHISFLYDLFYYYFPSFDKFRAPSMALAIMHFAMPILAGYGLTGMLKWKGDQSAAVRKKLNSLVIVSVVFLGLGILFSMGFETSYISSVTSSAKGQQFPAQLHQFLFEKTVSDWLTNAFILLIAVLVVYFYAKKKIGTNILYPVLGLLLIVDLWRVDYRPMEHAGNTGMDRVFAKTDLVQFIEQDDDLFRVADFTSPSPNVPAYFRMQSVGGYHSAKLRVYQDLMDMADQGSTSQVTNPFLWNLLNVKYILYPQQLSGMQPVFQSQMNGFLVYQNPGYLPRVFFVDSTKVAEPKVILQQLKDGTFNPTILAYIEEELNQNIEKPDSTVSAEVVEFKNEYIKIKANASGDNLLFISEIYYPLGWTAYLDEKEVEVIKTNFAFRGIVVPEGEHTIEMKFKSEGFETGKTLSLATNILTVLLLLGGIFIDRKNKQKNVEENNDKA